MAASTTKKALVRRFDREPLQAFVNPQEYLQKDGIEMLSPAGTVIFIGYYDLKNVCFVKDFDTDAEPAKLFQTRPKMDGLWVRMTYRDGDVMDGILPNHLLQWDRYGYALTPPEPYSNNQRVFVPREALTDIHVLGVVGSPLTKGTRRKPSAADGQPTLFD